LIQGMRANRSFGAITQSGDSGAIVVDKDRRVLGIVIAATADDKYTLAIPFSKAMDAISMDLTYQS
ncbi:MAG: hypothetical protein AAFR59_02515, partial [Bacteroidota bacterium]